MFKFKLQKLLEYKNLIEEQAKAELARVTHELVTNKKYALEIERLIDETTYKLQNLDVTELNNRLLYENYIKGLYQDHSYVEKKIQYWQLEVNKAKKILLEKSIEKKKVEKIKENQAEKYAKEELYAELKFNDEIANQNAYKQVI